MKYQTYFRIRRGGIGIPYELAKTEFTAVFEPFGLKIDRDYPERRRMWVDLDLLPDRVAVLASNLGYTEAIMHQKIEPYRGETLAPIERGRWYIGWIRQWEWKVYQTEVYVQDAKSLLNEGPDQRGFQIERDGEKQFVTGGHHAQRAVSALDARFLCNVAKLTPEMRILDPFAGCGGIVSEAKRRGLPIFAADIDASLSPGLAALAPKRYFIGDARTLPFSTACFDAIITEPPFRTQYRQAVMDALPELHRVLKPTGKIILLIAMDMLEDVQCFFEGVGKRVECVGVIPRGGGLKCPVLEVDTTTI